MRVRILLSLLLIGVSLSLNAQKIQIKGIPHIDKLPVNVINTIFQDSEGYIWYGTEDGLCRDDGYNIHTFRSDFRNPDILLSNVIISLAEDSVARHIWIGTDKGLYILNKQTYMISDANIAELKETGIGAIDVTSDHSIWISIYRKLYRLSPEGKVMNSYPLECISGAGKEFFLYEDRNKQLLLSISGKGLYKWNREKDEFELFFPHKDRITDIVQDVERNYYWLASWDHGVIRFDPSNPSKEEQYVPQLLPINSTGQTATTTMNIVQDDMCRYIWTTSWSDLFAYRITSNGTLEQVDISSFLPRQNKALKKIMKDKDGNLWVTAIDNHNFIIHFDENNLFRYNVSELEQQSKWTPIIELLCKDEKGVFWLFQRRLGLTLFQPDGNKSKCYTDFKSVHDCPFLVLTYLLKSRQEGLVWVVGQNSHKVYGLSQKGMEMKVECEIDLASVNPYYVFSLFEDKDGNLWIATDKALFVYQIGSKKLGLVADNVESVHSFTQTEDGTLWGVMKNESLIKIDRKKQLKVYPSRHSLLCVAASGNRLWVGTRKGELLLYTPETDSFESYNTVCGMNGDKINNIMVDRFHHIWIVTSQEIKEFNAQNGAYRSFYASDKNIGFNRFLPQSTFEAPDGQLYFGGVAGILSVSPSQRLESSSKQTTPLITDVKIMGRSILLDNERTGKSQKVIDIYPEEQNIEIRFSTLDYQNSQQIRYAYRLSGVDKEWIYLPAGRNSAFYNKLSKGKYVFQVKATDKNGLWNEQTAEIGIYRLPAWYETWIAYTLYLCIFLGITYYCYRMVRNRIRLRNALQLRELEQAKAEELNHAKLQFFTNITHELLTPLTVLSASVEELKQTAPSYKAQYKVMTVNIGRLIRLLQQILEFRKAETGNLKLKVSRGDLASFIQHNVNGFLPLMKKKGMQITVSCQPAPFMAYFDSDKFDKIIYNLLSNAAKYNLPDETVYIELSRISDEQAQLIVRDNGPGISKEAQKELFKRFYEGRYRKFNTIGTGIGLSLVNDLVKLHHGSITVESEEGHGAAFIVRFPVEKSSYSFDELDKDVPDNMDTVNVISSVKNEIAVLAEVEGEALEEQIATLPKENKYSLLLVEDNEELLQLMTRLLSTEYIVYTAKDGEEGITCTKQNDIDLIVSDVMMPVMDGIEFCRYIKGNFDTSHIPVILLTAKSQEEDRVEAYESGADGFISKPFSLSVLYARIGNLLSAHERKTKAFKKQIVFEAQELNYTSLDEEFLQQAIDCVHHHLDDPEFSQVQFVEEMNTTRSTAFRKLKSLTGLTFPAFLRNIRMKAACRIMEEKNHVKISELAYAVGYNEPRYFSTCFKKEIGMLPLEYMERFISGGMIERGKEE